MSGSAAPSSGRLTVVRESGRELPGRSSLPGFLALYAALYGAYGTESAFMPAFLLNHGLPVERIGLVFAAATLVRIVSGPAIGRLADRLRRRQEVLAVAAALSGLVGSAYALAFGLLPLLGVGLTHAAVSSSLSPLSDALSVSASGDGKNFQYGWVRGAGSAAFVVGTLLSGQLIDRYGLICIIATSSVLFLVMAVCAARLRRPDQVASDPVAASGAFRALWEIAAYRRLLLIVGLVIGSHALNDTFAVISWRAAGYDSASTSLLWSASVLAEVAMFFVVGPWLLARLGPVRCAAISAAAGVLRWGVMGLTTWMPALIATQALHGFTFALLHMVAMQTIAETVPERLAATAQTVYGALAVGISSAALTFLSGYIYGWFGIHAFWAMAALCLVALPWTGGIGASPARSRGPA